MILKDIKNSRYNSNGSIDCDLFLDGMDGPIPFTASPDDIEEQGRKIFALINSGKYGDIAPYSEPENISSEPTKSEN